MDKSTSDRFWAKVDRSGSCWLWTAARDRYGYGKFGIGQRLVIAHRFAYETTVGCIPDGLEIDHLCHVRACCNPAHLEPVTQQENLRRRRLDSARNHNRNKTHCAHGHPFDEDNTYVSPDGARKCRKCRARRKRIKRESLNNAMHM